MVDLLLEIPLTKPLSSALILLFVCPAESLELFHVSLILAAICQPLLTLKLINHPQNKKSDIEQRAFCLHIVDGNTILQVYIPLVRA